MGLFPLLAWGGGLLVGLSVFLATFPFPDAWDVPFHLYFAQEYSEAVAELGWLPDWDAAIYGGRGTAAFRFYAPAGYLVAAGFQWLGMPVGAALKATVLVFLAVGGWGLRRWLERLNLDGAFPLALLLFLGSPFLAIHLFRVFLFQNLCAVCLFPWVLAALEGIFQAGWTAVPAGAVAGGLAAWTHLPALLMMGYLAIPYLGARWWLASPAGPDRRLPPLAVMVTLAMGLAAPYVLEAVPELPTLHFESHMEIQTPWAHPSFLDDPIPPAAGPQAIAAGLLPLARPNFRLVMRVAMGIAFALAAWSAWRGGGTRRAVVPGLLAGSLALAFSLRLSVPLWQALPGWTVLQYPWRWVWPAGILLLPAMAAWTGAGHRAPGEVGGASRPPGPQGGPADLLPVAAGSRAGTLPGWLAVGAWLAASFWVQGTVGPVPPAVVDRALQGDFHYPCEYVPATCQVADCRLPRPLPSRKGPYHQLVLEAPGGRLELLFGSREGALFQAEIPTGTGTLWCHTHFDPFWRLQDAATHRPFPVQPAGPCGQMRAELPAGRATYHLFRVHSWRRTVGWALAVVAGLALVWLRRSFPAAAVASAPLENEGNAPPAGSPAVATGTPPAAGGTPPGPGMVS
ncbi:MAG: hypothetical protein GX442_25870 [Candidatus Riflebacteria bacterium]|nr:hypothetical protein [Candidatus Riflebacteria bacterium]